MNFPQPPILPPSAPKSTPTIITDIDIPFGRLVLIMVKFLLAALPAYLLLMVIMLFVVTVFGALFGGIAALMPHH